MPNITLTSAFIAGLVTFFAPCTFVTLPYFLTYLTSEAFGLSEEKDKKFKIKIFISSVIYILGFLLVFTLLGMTATAFGSLLNLHKEIFEKIGGIIILFFGLFILFGHNFRKLNFLQSNRKLQIKNDFFTNSYFSPFIIGMTSAFSWTPCIGPILGSILFVASYTTTEALKGGLLLFIYGLGMTLPFILFALFFSFLEKPIKKLNKYVGYIYALSGIILVLLGLSIITGYSDSIFREVYSLFINLGYKPQ